MNISKILHQAKTLSYLLFLLSFISSSANGQVTRFDNGKMWTFEHPPKSWFKEAYQFEPNDEWYRDVRLSALKFAGWCSASFVSPNGLIMTNHHCSRSVVGELMNEDEDFDKDGFYAEDLASERQAKGLFVDQLLYAVDITKELEKLLPSFQNDEEKQSLTTKALEKIKLEYSQKTEWQNLRLEIVTYYSGGKYSIYGYKRYDDIRLVMIPELDLGFFGGDYDNFTYPRYNLDFTFWRAYDDDGNPLNTSKNYFKFNPAGAIEKEPVFVVGNPARTERYRTIAQLEYDRDYRYPIQLELMNNRHKILNEQYLNDPSHNLQEQIFGLSNSIKAISGIWEGLQNPKLMTRKHSMETTIRSASSREDGKAWEELEIIHKNMQPYTAAAIFLGPGPIKGNSVNLLHKLHQYEQILGKNVDSESYSSDIAELKSEILLLSRGLNTPVELKYLATFLEEMIKFDHPENRLMEPIMNGDPPMLIAKRILEDSWFIKDSKAEKIMNLNLKKFRKCDDPMIELSRLLIPEYYKASAILQNSSKKRKILQQKVANNVYKIKGNDLAPDATFTLRLADGIVMGYDYNGTRAPWHTTYFGLYDRYYSFQKEFPWHLSEKWRNPSLELLRTPLNFVSTNDIIGGNSGSAIINRDKEVVGLIFDGNIESLPGNFIYDEEFNRSVSVHSGGLLAALKYVYKADRLYNELIK